jgi:predicted RNA-binding Zn ribbon-like protein
MDIYTPADRSTFEALMTVASGRHGPEAQAAREHTRQLPGGFLERLAHPADATYFLDHTARWWRENSEDIDWRLPRGEIPRDALARLREVRDAVQALADGDRAGYLRRLRSLAARYAFTLRIPEGGLRPRATGWDGFVASLVPPLAELADRAERLRRCANDRCQWMFLDMAKNGTRTWCHASLCGNKIRVRRFRERARAKARATATRRG